VAVLFLCFHEPKIEASLADCALGKIRKKARSVQTIFDLKKRKKRLYLKCHMQTPFPQFISRIAP
jgi:hypothetical protein